MTPATAFFVSLSLILWVGWSTDTWPSRMPTALQIGAHVLRSLGLLVLCALGAAWWTLAAFKVSP